MEKSYSPGGGCARRTRARFLAFPSLHFSTPFTISHVPLTTSVVRLSEASRSCADLEVVAIAEGLVCGETPVGVGVTVGAGAGVTVGTLLSGSNEFATAVSGADEAEGA